MSDDVTTSWERDTVEGEAWTDLVGPEHACWIGGARVLRVPEIPHLLLNRTIGLDAAAPATRTGVGAIVEHYREAGVPRFLVHVDADASPAISRWLSAASLTRYPRSWLALQRGREAIVSPPTSLRVREATPDDALAITRIFATAFDLPDAGGALFAGAVGRPGWHVLVACEGEQVVSAGALYVQERLGYLAGGATLPAYRGRGAQAALIAARVQRALDLRARAIFTDTGEAVPGDPQHSFRNLTRAGFRAVGLRHHYAPPDAAWRMSA